MAEEIKRISKIKFSNSDDEFVINDANAAAIDAWAYGTDVSAIADASHAEGHGTQTGTAGYLIPLNEEGKIQIDRNQITLKKEPQDLEIGDIISIQANGYYQWLDVAEIEEINGNIITCKTEIPLPNDEREYKAGVLFVAAKPKLNGDTIIGLNSHAEGFETCALADESHAEGYSTVAAGRYAHTEGCETKAAYASHAEGYGTQAANLHSHAEGYLTKASGKNSHAEGNKTQATHNQAHAEGYNTIASGACSHTEGYETTAENHSGHAEGYQTKATEQAAHVEGFQTEATGWAAHAEGYQTKATEQAAHVEGFQTEAREWAAHAEGDQTKATGRATHAEGEGTIATLRGQHAQGKYNEIDSENKYAHITGWGDDEDSRQNIHTLDTEGNAWFKGTIKSGENLLATEAFVQEEIKKVEGLDLSEEAGKIVDQNKHAEIFNSYEGEDQNIATGICSHAEGQRTEARGQASHAEGYKNIASGFDTHAEGYYTEASGAVQHVEGRYNIEDEGKYDISGKENPNAQVKYGKYAHIVGNGIKDSQGNITRSNAHTLDWDGNAWFAGDIYSGGENTEKNPAQRLPVIFSHEDSLGNVQPPDDNKGKTGDIYMRFLAPTPKRNQESTIIEATAYDFGNLEDSSWNSSDDRKFWIGERKDSGYHLDHYNRITFKSKQTLNSGTKISFWFEQTENTNTNQNINNGYYDTSAVPQTLQWYNVYGIIYPKNENSDPSYLNICSYFQTSSFPEDNICNFTKALNNAITLTLSTTIQKNEEYYLYLGRKYTDSLDGFSGATKYTISEISCPNSDNTTVTEEEQDVIIYIKGKNSWFNFAQFTEVIPIQGNTSSNNATTAPS